MFQSRNVEQEVNHQVAVIVIWHIRQTKAMMERRQKIQKYKKLLVAEYETDGSMKFITGEDLERIVTNEQSRESEFDEKLQKHLQSSLQGSDELEMKDFYRKIYKKCKH